ncbi:MAG TPA: lysylphosphatidylglycerol synthase domain-containing protein [Candidatus Saccharimonadales bacterium]|nr:lysylphosphatidylglycerol synthase domain-containing protein [Candidatus Saccharimonadales bacterium]
MNPSKTWKSFAAIAVIVITVTAFIYFFVNHPAARRQLANLNPLILLVLLLLYGIFLVSLVMMLQATLSLCGINLKKGESFLLSAYSAIVNFFGPLQSGPGFRAVYLKKKHGIDLKKYALATLLYYGLFAGFSGLFLVSGLVGWAWLGILAVAGLAVAVFVLRSNLKSLRRFQSLNLKSVYRLALATLAQLSINAVIYFVELRAISPGIHFSQAVIYSGAANFALFVSITPGAIGFRESFLLLSSRLHHIDKVTVLNASLIDRGVYVIFLALLFIVVLSLHAKDRLQLSALKNNTSQ